VPLPAATEKVSFWKRWLTPIPALSAAVFAGTLILSFWLYQHLKSVPNTPELVAIAPHTTEPASAQEMVIQPSPAPREGKRVPSEKKTAVQQPETRSAPTITGAETMPVAGATPAPPPVPPQSALLDAAASNAASGGQTGIVGTITDPAGAAVPGAAVKLSPIAGTAGRNSISDPKGQFNVAGLEPGRYELQVVAPGFQPATKQVDIRSNQMARADSTLSLGSVSESVTVTAESAQVQTEAKDQLAGQPLPARLPVQARSALVMNAPAGITVNGSVVVLLPNKLRADKTVLKGKLMLATDSAGALFLSQNAGKNWKAVKPVWHGKVVSLVALTTPASSSSPAFQLTTDSGAIWLSRDGSRWYAAPAQK
jgi:hypothetical protein